MLLNVLFTVKKQSLSLSGRSLGSLGKNIPGKICEKCELEYDKKLKSPSGQVAYNEKRKKHTNQTPWEEYVAKAFREFCSLSMMIPISKQQSALEKDALRRLLRAKKVVKLMLSYPNQSIVKLQVDERQPFPMQETSWMITVSILCPSSKKHCWNVDMLPLSLVVESQVAYKQQINDTDLHCLLKAKYRISRN